MDWTDSVNKGVCVIISAYNGEDYIVDQIQSVLDQEGVSVRVVVRDDGSSDRTVARIQEAFGDERVSVIQGQNIGYARSFMEALRGLDGFDYYAFCDQDDIWLPDKLSCALRTLDAIEGDAPKLYCSDRFVCDENCTVRYTSKSNDIPTTKQNILFSNVCSGNTMVFNSGLREVALHYGLEDLFAHDWWLALCAMFCGQMVWDKSPHILYRRLEGSVSTSGVFGVRLLVLKIGKIVLAGNLRRISRQTRAFFSMHPEFEDEESQRIATAINEGGRLRMATLGGRYRRTLPAEIAVRLMLLFGIL